MPEHFESHLEKVVGVRRLWMLVPRSQAAYVPGFEGSFEEALVEAAAHAAFWKTPVQVYEADPRYYRREGGLKELWAEVRVPPGSPLRPA